MSVNASSSPEFEVSEAIKLEVVRRLRIIEEEREIRVLYACESGSRAWGFASADSDYDVRFIYARPVDQYLRLKPPVDAFDEQIVDDFDFGGWDVRKTSELMRKSNPPLMEWLDSPFVYLADKSIVPRLRQLRFDYFDAKKTVYHYLSMARNVWRTHLADAANPVRKKYLYALRPLACIAYVCRHQKMAPTRFEDVLQGIGWSDEVMQSIGQLIKDKKQGGEIGTAPADKVLGLHIEKSLTEGEVLAESLETNSESSGKLDQLIADVILNRV